MRRTLLTLTAAFSLAAAAQAQVSEKYAGNMYWQMSPDGKLLVESTDGVVGIRDRATGATYSYAPDGVDGSRYSAGLGHAVSGNGIVVGNVGDAPAVWKGGEWAVLDQPQGAATGMNLANAVSADGSRIVGLLGVDGASMADDNTYAEPALWTLQEDGSYKAQVLPYPEKDFLGLPPQYVTAVDISENGKTIVGQVIDCSGFYVLPIVYTESAEGKWSYTIPGADYVYDAEKVAALPARPVAPEAIAADSYMTGDDAARYNAALKEYQELREQANAGIISPDEVPPYPQKWAYITDNRDRWVADSTAYDAADKAYQEADMAYTDAVYAAVTGASFELNAANISGNGQYVATSLNSPGATFWESLTRPALIEVATGKTTPAETADMISGSAMNDGSMTAFSPIMSSSRQGYVVKKGETAPTLFADYLAEKGYTKNLEFLKDNFVFSVEEVSYDESGDPVYTENPDSLITGSVAANSDGTIFISYLYNTFGDASQYGYLSYILDTHADAVAGIRDAAQGDAAAPVLRREYYSLDGRRIAAPAKGIYLERLTTAEGTKTYKRVR